MSANPFWQFSLSTYQRPGLEDLCLRWQDDVGGDVNMLLCAAWLASIGQPLTQQLLTLLLAESQEWQQSCVQPLRRVRRYLKGRAGLEVYRQAKALELEAECLQQQQLYKHLAMLPQLDTAEDLLAMNLQVYLNSVVADKQALFIWQEDFCRALNSSN